MPRVSNNAILKFGLVLLAIAALAFGVRNLPLHAWLREVDAWVTTLGWAGPLVYGAIYCAAVILLVPRGLLTVAAGFLFGMWKGALVSLCAASLAAAAAFLGARYLFRARVQRWTAGHPKARAVEGAVSEHGAKVVVLLRLSPLVHYGLSNYFYGVMSLGFWPFFVAGTLGTLPGTLLAVWVGSAGHRGLSGHHDTLRWVYISAGLVATVAASVYVGHLARRALRSVSGDTRPPR